MKTTSVETALTLSDPEEVFLDEEVLISNKLCSTREENGKTLQYSCFENPMNNMKRQRAMTLKDELPRSAAVQYATEYKQKKQLQKE